MIGNRRFDLIFSTSISNCGVIIRMHRENVNFKDSKRFQLPILLHAHRIHLHIKNLLCCRDFSGLRHLGLLLGLSSLTTEYIRLQEIGVLKKSLVVSQMSAREILKCDQLKINIDIKDRSLMSRFKFNERNFYIFF